MTTVQLDVRRQAHVRRPPAEVWSAVQTMPALTSLIAIVERCDQLDDGWRWDLGRHGALGLNVHVTFDVAAAFRPKREIAFEPIGDAARWARGRGRVLLDAAGDGTDVEVELAHELRLSVPGLLARPLGGVITREVGSAIEDFLRRLVAQVEG